jgi:hypothetical protein
MRLSFAPSVTFGTFDSQAAAGTDFSWNPRSGRGKHRHAEKFSGCEKFLAAAPQKKESCR